MEIEIGHSSQDELDVENTARLAGVAHIKLEMGDIDTKLTESKSLTACLQAPSTNYGDDWGMFASYSSSASDQSNLEGQPMSIQVHFPQLPVDSYQEPLPAPSFPSLEQTFSVPFTSSCDQPSAAPSLTWYKQPSSTPPVHSRRVLSEIPPSGTTEQAPSAPLWAEGSNTRSVSQTQSVQTSISDACVKPDNKKGDKDLNQRPVQQEEKMPVTTQAVKPSGRLTRQASRACAERVERTTRQLRANQSKTKSEVEKGVTPSPVSEKLVRHSQSPPHLQEPEMLPPAAKELRPRRLTRKPRHTQRVWRPEIRGEPVDRWRVIGQSQGLTNDTEIAVFLMQHYENTMSRGPTGICVNCQTVLTLTCTACQAPSLTMETDSAALSSSSLPANMEDREIEAKMEPIDLLPPRGEQEPRQQQEPEPDPEPEELEASDEMGMDVKEEEEEKPQPGQRRRGRPVGSGKKSTVKVSGIKPKLKARKYKCTYDGCEAAFAKSSRLKIHTRIHTGEKPYLCKDCGKAFTQKSGLTVHSQKHTGLRPFTCEECGSSFPSSSTLKQHMRRHTGEKPFICKKCNKTFRWSGHLTQHMRMHNGIKPFLCPDCGKSFSASSDLVKHRVTHTKSRPYKCDKCDKAYAFQHRLTAHHRSHTGDRPFLCSECGAAFSRAHNLTVHMRTHTGDKPYWCKDCGAKFSDSGNFCKHKKTKHGENAKNTQSTKPARVPSVKVVSTDPDCQLTASLDVGKLSEYECLLEMSKVGKVSPTNSTGQLPSIAKVVGKIGSYRAAETVKLPSMAKMVGRAKRERDRREGIALGTMALTSMSVSSTPSSLSPHHNNSSPSNLPADFKNLLPPMGSDQMATALPPHLSPSISMGSPPALPVQNQLTASPAVSPAITLPVQSSSGPGLSNDSGLSPLSQSAHQMTDHRAVQHDEVVFPPQYYGSYPYYYQQQQ